MERNYFFTPGKINYVAGTKRPDVPCILCSIVEKDPRVSSLEVYRTDNFIVSVNLYPYNLGHLIIFPVRHVEDISPLTEAEVLELHNLQILSMEVNKHIYNTTSFNIGYNIGDLSGASIKHLHMHVVPRYAREVGFIDVLNGTRVIVEDPVETVKKLTEAFKNISSQGFQIPNE